MLLMFTTYQHVLRFIWDAEKAMIKKPLVLPQKTFEWHSCIYASVDSFLGNLW